MLCCIYFFYFIWQAGCLRSGRSHSDKAEASWDKVDPRSERSPVWTLSNLLWIIKPHSGKFSWDKDVFCCWYYLMCIAHCEALKSIRRSSVFTIATHFERPHMEFLTNPLVPTLCDWSGNILKSSHFNFFQSCVTLYPSTQSSTKSNFSK